MNNESFQSSEDFKFSNYRPDLNKSDSSLDNSNCVRLIIASLAVNIDKLQSLVNKDNFFFVECITTSAALQAKISSLK